MTSTRLGEDCAYRAVTEIADEGSVEQARRRAARWHAWLKSPQCTFQDRENFERWCSDAANAAAYVALCGDLALGPELTGEAVERPGFEYAAPGYAPRMRVPRLEAEPG